MSEPPSLFGRCARSTLLRETLGRSRLFPNPERENSSDERAARAQIGARRNDAAGQLAVERVLAVHASVKLKRERGNHGHYRNILYWYCTVLVCLRRIVKF